jgi:hypothetical protein
VVAIGAFDDLKEWLKQEDDLGLWADVLKTVPVEMQFPPER